LQISHVNLFVPLFFHTSVNFKVLSSTPDNQKFWVDLVVMLLLYKIINNSISPHLVLYSLGQSFLHICEYFLVVFSVACLLHALLKLLYMIKICYLSTDALNINKADLLMVYK